MFDLSAWLTTQNLRQSILLKDWASEDLIASLLFFFKGRCKLEHGQCAHSCRKSTKQWLFFQLDSGLTIWVIWANFIERLGLRRPDYFLVISPLRGIGNWNTVKRPIFAESQQTDHCFLCLTWDSQSESFESFFQKDWASEELIALWLFPL